MDLASVVAALATVGVRVSGSAPNSSVQVDSSRACPPGLAGPEPSGTINDLGQHFHTIFFEFEPTSPSTTTTPTAAYLRTTTTVRSSTCSFAGDFGTPRRAPEQTGQEVHG